MTRRIGSAAPLTVVALFGLILAYGGAYAALVEPRVRLRMQPDGCCRPMCEARYRAGGEIAAMVFAPACQVDRLVRPRRWHAD